MDLGLEELMKPGSLGTFLGAPEIPSKQDQLPTVSPAELDSAIKFLVHQKKSFSRPQIIDVDAPSHIVEHVPIDVNAVLARSGDIPNNYDKARSIYRLMKATYTPVDLPAYRALILNATNRKQYHEANDYFDDLMNNNLVPDISIWAAKIRNEAQSKNIDQALQILEQLKKLNMHQNVELYNPILKVLVHEKQYEKSLNFFTRMHTEGLTFNTESFSIMIRQCAQQGAVERAFFYFDEMRSLQILPDKSLFCNLIKSCGRAPYWVNGYEDIFFDALTAMESCEYKPDTDIYNAIISAFAQAGDSIAAEYYFWEMKRKNLKPNAYTYGHLLHAYGKAQSVGAANYGWKGRYCKPKEKPLTPDEEDMKELGPARVAKICKYHSY